MTAPVAAVVGLGLALALAYGLAGGLDAVSAVLLVTLGILGALGVAAARRAGAGRITPRTCPECEGLVSPAAPYCKHCGAPLGAPES